MELYNILFREYLNSLKNSSSNNINTDINLVSTYISENGTYYANKKEAFNVVTVDVDSGYVPHGTSYISDFGIYDILGYEYADVDVAFPYGTSYVTSNSLYNVTSFYNIDVNVSQGVVVSGNKYVYSNGLYDVKTYSSAYINTGKSYLARLSNLSGTTTTFGAWDYVEYRGVSYATTNYSFNFYEGEILNCYTHGASSGVGTIYLDGSIMSTAYSGSVARYAFTLPGNDININLNSFYSDSAFCCTMRINNMYSVYSITQNGLYSVGAYDVADVEIYDSYNHTFEDELLERTISLYSNSSLSSIEQNAFRECTYLSSIDLPNCSTIGNSAFANCSSLENVNFPNCVSIGTSVFSGCTSLLSLSLSLCNTIGTYAFRDCSSLSSIDLPMCISIASYAFYNTSLQFIELPNCLSIGQSAFANCPISYANLSVCNSIDSYAFASCSLLSSVSLASETINQRIDIRSNAFKGCEYLESINNSSNITYIGVSAFYGCSSLTSLNLNKCEKIDEGAFIQCGISSIYLPVCSIISNTAFYNCINLTTIECSSCISLGSRAFSACYNLQSISLPECESIGYACFLDCSSLKTVYAPKCTYIATYAFNNCGLLSMFDWPLSCSSIKTYTFQNCNHLESLYLRGSDVVSLQEKTAFYGTPMLESSHLGHFGSIFVPSSLVDAYKTATTWTVFSNRIAAIPE